MKRRRRKARTPLQVAVAVMLQRLDVSLRAFATALGTAERPESHQNVNQKMAKHEPTVEFVRQLADGLGIAEEELKAMMVHEYQRALKAGRPLACRPMVKDKARATVVLA